MASTDTLPKEDHTKAEKKTAETAPKELTHTEALIAEIGKYYGVELAGNDYDKFFVDVNTAALDRTKGHLRGDPVEQARLDEKIALLRNLVADGSKATTPDQDILVKALEDSKIEGVGLTFNDDGTFRITANGGEDTGPTNDKDAFLAAINRLKPQQA